MPIRLLWYKEGVNAKEALQDGRKRVADFLHAHPDEIVFTSGGTEANGLALEGAGRTAHRNGIQKPHLIISAIEHSSVIEVANMMEKYGVEVTRLPVDASGTISLDELRRSIKPSTFLVSIMTVNNEIGTVLPIREIAKIIRHAREHITKTQYPLFHTDAAQAALHSELEVAKLGVDLLTLDSSKVYGPRGMGALFVKRNTPIEPIMYGGGQEKGLRSGTENLPGIMGFAKALEIAGKEREGESVRIGKLRAEFIKQLKEVNAKITINGKDHGGHGINNTDGDAHISPHILNISIPHIDNELFVLRLDAKGIACSTKSSCLRDQDESYVLSAIGADSKTSLRFSFGRWTKKGDISKTVKAISIILKSYV